MGQKQEDWFETLYQTLSIEESWFEIEKVYRGGNEYIVIGSVNGMYYCDFNTVLDEKMNIIRDESIQNSHQKLDDLLQQFLYKERVRIVSGMYAQGEENE